MSKKTFKPILKYLLQLLLLTFPLVTIANIILLIVDNTPLFPFASGICMFVTQVNLWINGIVSPTMFGPVLGFAAFIIGELPCILILILYITSFLGVINKKNRALTYLQYFAIIETVLLTSNRLCASVYGVLVLMLLFRKEYLDTDDE